MPVREQLLQIHRDLYDRFRSSARRSVGPLRPGLRRYFIEYQREYTDYKGISSPQELVRAAEKASVLVCGDYHTLAQAQRAALGLFSQLLPVLRSQGKTPLLALEFLQPAHRRAVEGFMRQKISEKQFIKAIGYQRHWGFEWRSYRAFFEFARTHGVPLLALSKNRKTGKPSLVQRDRAAAQAISKALEETPNAFVFALMGDLHLAKNHLPAQLEAQSGKAVSPFSYLVVHQNRENLYWKLASRGLEHKVAVLQLDEGVYCLMNTPPWVKLQSYLKWLDWSMEGSGESSSFAKRDYDEDFSDLVRTIGKFIGLETVPASSFEIRWVPPTRPNSPKRQASAGLTEALLAVAGSYFNPKTKEIFLTSTHVNSAATQAAFLLHACLSGRTRTFQFPRQDFFPTIWLEALGFLGSKVINPHRKCYQPEDFSRASPSGRFVKMVVQHFQSVERHFSGQPFVPLSLPARPLTPSASRDFYRAARSIGQILGERLYAACVSNHVSIESLASLFHNPFHNGKDAQRLYLAWMRKMRAL